MQNYSMHHKLSLRDSLQCGCARGTKPCQLSQIAGWGGGGGESGEGSGGKGRGGKGREGEGRGRVVMEGRRKEVRVGREEVRVGREEVRVGRGKEGGVHVAALELQPGQLQAPTHHTPTHT